MKALKQASCGAALLLLAAGPAVADSASTTISVSVRVVAPGSLSGAVVGPGTGRQGLVAPIPAEAPKAQGKADPAAASVEPKSVQSN